MIRLFFGSPRSGKTTIASKLMFMSDSPYKFSNFDCDLSIPITSDYIGQYAFPDYSEIYIDEAGIDYNNRNYKSLSQNAIEYFKLHGHFKNDIYLFSQSWEDTDVTLRRLTDELWYIKRIGGFTLARKVRKKVMIDKNTHQIIDGYRFAGVLWSLLPKWLFGEKTVMFFYRKPYYKHFDSYSRPKKFLPLPPHILSN